MKNYFLLLLSCYVLLPFTQAQAQLAPFGVYKPVIVPQRSYSLPVISFPDPRDEIEAYNAQIQAEARAQAQAMEIISSDVVSVDGLNYYTETYSPLKVKIVRRRNGQTELECLGIKKNGIWSTCDKGIASLEAMYKNATKESDKTMILELMEYGNYLLIVDVKTEVYIIK